MTYPSRKIRSFKDKELEAFFERQAGAPGWMPSTLRRPTLVKLQMLDSVNTLRDMGGRKGLNCERLKGDLKEYYSIRINDQYRLVFIWRDGDDAHKGAYEVHVMDYH